MWRQARNFSSTQWLREYFVIYFHKQYMFYLCTTDMKKQSQSRRYDRENPEGVSISKKSVARLTTSPSSSRKTPPQKATMKRAKQTQQTSQVQSPLKRREPPGDSSFHDMTPETLSQISSIMPPDDSTMVSSLHSPTKKRRQADTTMEMAVQMARGEPDGADGSFRKSPKKKASQKLTGIPEEEESPVRANGKENSTLAVQKKKCIKVCISKLWGSLKLVKEVSVWLFGKEQLTSRK